ncbi:hypothetical protein GTY65_34150 [Streptomyces sp. SID8379]|uniref:hypothetical protein n=1 Tax=unclassified Streptomyces TaxID=2593676 RepID=UPI000376535F|nr:MULTISPECIES: hypothetical protein [unclassified Streptomyces]MYW69080.1 hypothetical protein [Streptomyces sp. SID8379]
MNLELFSQKLIGDDSLSVTKIIDRLAAWLSQQEDRGAGEAVACLLATRDDRVAEFAAQYLALLPRLHAEKNRVAQRLRGDESLVPAASRLVPWLSEQLLGEMIDDYLGSGEPYGPLFDIIYEVGLYQPALLRPHLSRIEDADVRFAMMSGSPDDYVPGFVDRWRRAQKAGALNLLARMRTEAAAQALLGLRADFSEPAEWETLVEMAGRLPDADERSGYAPASMGSVVDRGESPHVMGGSYPGELPLCPVCEKAAERVLTLSAAELPFPLSADPSFFWYTCACHALDFVTVKLAPTGLEVYYGPQGTAPEDNGHVVPGERALALEPHPNQLGISLDGTGGNSRHQVGGLPRWITPAPHPRCPECGLAMRFVASVDSGPTPFGHLAFEGTLYGFWCDACHVSSVQHQA